MTRLEEDIAFLQRAADTAGLAIWPGSGNLTFPEITGNNSVPAETLAALAGDLEERRLTPREVRLIDYEAVWLLRAAQQLVLHRLDGDLTKAARFQRLCEHLRSAVELDLVNARKALGD